MENNKNMNNGRYYAKVEETARKVPEYVVIDRETGERKAVCDCMLWATHKAAEFNRKAAEEKKWGGKTRQK